MIEVRFEGGPWDGQFQAVQDTPPYLYVIAPDYAKDLPGYYAEEDPFSGPIEVRTKKITYYRERAEHYWQVVTYFDSEEARDRAFYEDTREHAEDLEDSEYQLSDWGYASPGLQQGRP